MYWEMIDTVREAWDRSCSESLNGVPHLNFESCLLDHLNRGLDEADLSDDARAAASQEASRRLAERQRILKGVRFVERRLSLGENVREIELMSGRREIGVIRYGVCPVGEHGWVGKISLGPNWQRGGLGRRAMRHLMERYPRATWTTSAQFAAGFWAQFRQESGAGWTVMRGPCEHGWEPVPSQVRHARQGR